MIFKKFTIAIKKKNQNLSKYLLLIFNKSTIRDMSLDQIKPFSFLKNNNNNNNHHHGVRQSNSSRPRVVYY